MDNFNKIKGPVKDESAFNESGLRCADNSVRDWVQTGGEGFRNNLENDINKGNGSKLGDSTRSRDLRNE